MKDFTRFLTIRNVLSWPVIAVTALWLVFANLVDTSTNGTGNVPERIIIVLGTLVIFYSLLIAANMVFIRRVRKQIQWLALWITIAILSLGRGLLLAVIWLEVGLSSELSPWSRAIAGLTNLALLMVFIAVAYGMFNETARARQQLERTQERLFGLRNQFIENRVSQNEQLLETVRKRLADALSPELLDSPQQTIDSIRSSIDEVIRPLSRTLAQPTQIENAPVNSPSRGFNTRRFLRRLFNVSEIQILPGLILFELLMLTPLTNVLGPGKAPIIDLLMAFQLLITTWILKFVIQKMGKPIVSWSTPLVLMLSAGIGVFVFVPLMPDGFQLSFSLGCIVVYFFCTMVPIALNISVNEARMTAQELEEENNELAWALARSNEVTQQQTKTIATALHGRLQASLAAAAFRLQIALRDGLDPTEAQTAAKIEAEKAIAFDVDVHGKSITLDETIREITELWAGVCEIKILSDASVISRIEDDPVCSRLCSELVIELCTNAIKHGKARTIEISLKFETSRILSLEISNDGDVYDANSSGYGTQLLDQSCVSWSQNNHEGRTLVKVLAPWSEDSSEFVS